MNFIIISLKHSESCNKPCFWRSNDCGYTESPFMAGIYTENQIREDPNYYNDGLNNIAVPLSDNAMSDLGFKCSFNPASIPMFLQSKKQFAHSLHK